MPECDVELLLRIRSLAPFITVRGNRVEPVGDDVDFRVFGSLIGG